MRFQYPQVYPELESKPADERANCAANEGNGRSVRRGRRQNLSEGEGAGPRKKTSAQLVPSRCDQLTDHPMDRTRWSSNLRIWLVFVLLLLSSSAARAEKITIAYTSRSYAFIVGHVAVAKGFFREEGIEALMVQMRGAVAVPAVVNGEAHYSLGFSNILAAILQGMPLKFVAVTLEKPVHYLVAKPEIDSVAKLKGKTLGISRVGGADHLAAQAILQAKGVEPREIKLVPLGGDEPVRLQILRKGLVEAISISPPGPIPLLKEGFRVLGGPRDIKVGNPVSGVSTTEGRLAEKADEVRRFLRATLRGLRFVHERREETINVMMQWLGQTREDSAASYDMIFPALSRDGAPSDATLQLAVEAHRTTAGVTKAIPLSQVRDFSILRELQKEMALREREK